MIRWIDSLAEWDGALPGVLLIERATRETRHELLWRMSAKVLKLAPERVSVEHGEGRPPIIAKPFGSGLYLSSASRDGFAAVAVAPSPVGVDVEIAEIGGWIPWNVLHPNEVAFLEQETGAELAMNFARIWSLKEAYLKAEGVGFQREPSSFAVQFLDGERARIEDPEAAHEVLAASTTWRGLANSWAAVSAVVLKRQAPL
jgi:phosphopantetheinyl transferase